MLGAAVGSRLPLTAGLAAAKVTAMGFPTPFPEPDSPELRRFAVRSRAEILARLYALQSAAVPLNVFVDADASFGVVTLRRVDEVVGELVFAGASAGGSQERLPSAPLTTFVCYDDLGKVQFATRPATCGGGSQLLATPIPELLFSLQRRGAARMRVDDNKVAVCRIPVPDSAGEWEALRVLDISTGGMALLTYPERFEPKVGSEIGNCRLDLPGVGGAVISVRVRHLGTPLGEEAARCCGCEFLRMTPALGSMIARFVAER